jgi:hypothetical protein
MSTTNGSASRPRNRIQFTFSFPHPEEKRRDGLLRGAWMLIVAPFKCRPDPRGPWDETNTGDQTPWEYPLALARNAMASAVIIGDPELIEKTLEGVRAFAREFEADIASMVPAREEEGIIAVALAETDVEGPANKSQAVLIAHPSPTTAASAIIPLERHHERIGKLVRKCRELARANPSMVQVMK